jgi:hypothetical protein
MLRKQSAIYTQSPLTTPRDHKNGMTASALELRTRNICALDHLTCP